ncbi:MAG: helix-turn-helix domain-containing protein [Lentisphaerae bacterium]|nr:MAG: helix-turn-helix domain-containing protein [Lentisphaerota bacterium]
MRVINISIQVHLRRFRKVYHWGRGTPSTPFWRLWWNEQNSGIVEAVGKTFNPGPGKLLLIPPHTLVHRTLSSPTLHFHCHFNLGFPWDLVHDHVFEVEAPPNILAIIDDIMSDPGSPEQFALVELLMDALRQIPRHVFEGLRLDQRIERIIDYMSAHIDRIIPNSELANLLHLTPNSLTRLFKSQTGLSPQLFHRQLRLDHAALLLIRNTQMTIDEIAENTGFHDRHHFSKAFKKRYHYSPSAYRHLNHR